ncbi:MAG: ribonuclease III [Pauljensenia sp.]|uniref:ribonuclease III n=1 Tax=Actinomycetaceae TaxID=2049 RepID=UPI0001F0FC24|nr:MULTISPECIES: ribonuclease III [Actinomycetaceae]EFU62148.1 ribonuclease III [Actinomyces sp. oral taxon 180 str. F0310]UUO94315.1 ribonuclease III [Schaalia odontolytica]
MGRSKHLPVPPRTDTDALVEAWGTRIEPTLLQLALVHRSYANEAGGIANNERLEFLGDSVLSIVIAQKLYEQYPDVAESDLSRMRAATVSQQPLAAAARRIGLGDFVFLGKGESTHGGRDKDSILSDTFEALIGATYLTSGLEEARRVILARLGFLLADAPSRGQHQDWKTLLVEYSQSKGLGEVSYEVEGEGPDHQRVFTARAYVSESSEALGEGRASSKKHAENAAAQDAMKRLAADEE